MAKIDRLYQDELFRLQNLAAEYARHNPSQAGRLVSSGTDPDVERILEGVAFLTAGLRAELEQDQGQLLNNLLQVAAPELLRPLPSITLIRFTPKQALKTEQILKIGTPVSGLNANGRRCEFRTLQSVRLCPIEISAVQLQSSKSLEPGKYKLSLTLDCHQGGIEQLRGQTLPLYLQGNSQQITQIMGNFLHHNVAFDAQFGEQQQSLSLDDFYQDTALMQWPMVQDEAPELPAQRILQRYFMLPELAQGLRVETDFIPQNCDARRLTLNWYFDQNTQWPSVDLAQVFQLFVVPAINLFQREAPPQVRVLRQTETLLAPRARSDEQLSVYSIKQIFGQFRSRVEAHEYRPFWQQGLSDSGLYQERLSTHPVDNSLQLSVVLSGHELSQEQEMIRAALLCSNGADTVSLAPGALSEHTSGSPELADFYNLLTPTPYRDALPSEKKQRQSIQQLCGNLLGGLNLNALHNSLRQLAALGSPDQARYQVSLRKIDSIKAVEICITERLVAAHSLRGYQIKLTLSGDHFTSGGEMKVFLHLLQQFFINLVPVNYFCELVVTDQQTGETMQWQPMLGKQLLL
ncbi:Type VI secretion system, ImpG, VasA, VC_A0110 [Oceanospirillum multiglobuliferum]|uniref:Type VI secretion system protein ImpG n=1 Tax=Oceanospirillum multiglobuliferum TaxID=64969 RepID=A0A1T4MT39_9GAMM|nr:type VI secretion system baseplate subunit TssF [Oceanospirillum multiglobuliferum]OPX56896.1 hypothetical protein BTE48_00215 [Oceanospirillum multiglobuliferum]SJZ70239.1 Type VI secretion system, ImpG, VasA, VC_A0110 [Oceanospirillum multiglobuliferum]